MISKFFHYMLMLALMLGNDLRAKKAFKFRLVEPKVNLTAELFSYALFLARAFSDSEAQQLLRYALYLAQNKPCDLVAAKEELKNLAASIDYEKLQSQKPALNIAEIFKLINQQP